MEPTVDHFRSLGSHLDDLRLQDLEERLLHASNRWDPAGMVEQYADAIFRAQSAAVATIRTAIDKMRNLTYGKAFPKQLTPDRSHHHV